MSTNTELIEKARAWSRQNVQALPWIAHDEMQALADALEGAEADMWKCEVCAALITDREKHAGFHREFVQAQIDIDFLEGDERG